MISNLAMATLADMRSQGLSPTDEDVVRLNALGLKCEHNRNTENLAGCPRVAFVGDLVLREPTLAHQIVIDEALQVLEDLSDYERVCFLAFILNDNPCPEPSRPKKIKKALRKFAQEQLLGYTQTELVAAITYCLTGATHTALEHPAPTKREKELIEERKKLNEEYLESIAHHLICEAGILGIDRETAMRTTLPSLNRMIMEALVMRGAKKFKNDTAVADFYRTADEIMERLKHDA